MKTALIPGSFDPFTLGHKNVVTRALTLFDRVVVAVMNNSGKEYMFSAEERVKIAKLTLSGLRRVKVIYCPGMTYELFRETGACAIVKGIRNASDLRYELPQYEFNREAGGCETVFLPSDPEFSGISSTGVRKMLQGEGRRVSRRALLRRMDASACDYIVSLGRSSRIAAPSGGSDTER
ncbi:MAG: pantetheine-phosphate adenylyltransferase [Clostridia bacterium]|jgi:pantetheine-phosphate adenylyltransferase|nr:pantetheine-phosphate adenylyltransferase [Clostridia bacterium]